MDVPFQYYLRVRYSECDAQKVVFNARYGDYVDQASTYFFKAVLAELNLAITDFDYQVVKHTIEWQAPARFDDVLRISVSITHTGNTSFTYITEMVLADCQTLVAKTETIGVAVDAQTLQKTPLSEPIKAALKAGSPNTVVDHAGYLSC